MLSSTTHPLGIPLVPLGNDVISVCLTNVPLLATPLTQLVKQLFADLALEGKILFIANEDAENLYMATRNLGNVLVLFADEINVYDLVNADVIVVDEASLARIEEVLK